MMEVESNECPNSEENKDGGEAKETVGGGGGGGGDGENEVKELGSGSNGGSQISDEQKPEETEKAEAVMEEEADGESEPEFFNMEDFEVVDVVEDEGDDQETQCTSPSQISDSREVDISKTRIKHGQTRKPESNRSHKHQEKKDRPHNQKDISRSSREGRRSSSGSSKNYTKPDSKEKLRKAPSKDKASCDLARSLSKKSDKQKSSRSSHDQDTKRAVDKERCCSHRTDHNKRDRHHLDSRRRDDKRACVKGGESDHRKKESQRAGDRQVQSEKNRERKSSHPDQQDSDKRGSDKHRSDKKMKDKENSDRKSDAKRKQSEKDREKIEKEKGNSKKINQGISNTKETCVDSAGVSASCKLTGTICETGSVSCVTSSASLEKSCANNEATHESCEITSATCETTFTGCEALGTNHETTSCSLGTAVTTCEIASASLDKTSAVCEITGASCELTHNEEHTAIDESGMQEPKKNELKEKFRCKNSSSKEMASSDMPPVAMQEEDFVVEAEQGTKDSKQKDHNFKKTSEDFEMEDLECKPAADSCKQEDSKFEQATQVSKEEHFEPKQAMDDSELDPESEQMTKNPEQKVPKSEKETEYSELKDPKSKQAADEFRQENPKFKLAAKDSRQEDHRFNQTTKDSNWNDTKSEEMTEDSKQKDPKVEHVTKDHEQKDLKIGETAEDSKQGDPKSEQATEVSKQENSKDEEGVQYPELEDPKFKEENVDSKQENGKSRQTNVDSKEKCPKQEAEDFKKGDAEFMQEICHSEMKDMKLKQEEQNVEKEVAECKQETEDVRMEGGIPEEDGASEVVLNTSEECKGTVLKNESDHLQTEHHVLHHKAGQTEGETASGSEQANVSDEMKDQISRYIEMIRKEVDKKEAKEVEDSVYKKVTGRPSSYKFSKVIIIGDSRIKYFENSDLKKRFDNLEIKCVPCLTLDNLQEVVDMHVMKRKYPQGILLICSVGIYNIIGFCTNISCKKDHKPMEQIYIRNSLASSVIGKMRAVRFKLQKMLGEHSEVFFSTILPVNITNFTAHQVKIHRDTTGHTPVVRSDWSELESTVHKVINKFNNRMIKISVRKDGKKIPWDFAYFHGHSVCQKALTKDLENGLDPSRDATLTHMVPLFQYTLKQYYMNRYQKVVLIGDSRTEVVAKNWPCYNWSVFTILTQSRLCFQDLTEENAIVKEIVGMKDSLIVISLGMYDFLKYATFDGCKSHEELEIPYLYHEKSDEEVWDEFIDSLKKADQLLHRVTYNCDVIITTIYPFDFFVLKNFEIQRHAAATGHVVKSVFEFKALDEKLNKIKEFIKRINRIAIKLSQEKQLPVWDFNSLVCDSSHVHSKDDLTLFDGAHPSPEMANRIAEACVSYGEASSYLCCPDSIPHDLKDIADLENRPFTHSSNISSIVESIHFTLPLSQLHDEKERKENSVHRQNSGYTRCKTNKNLLSVNLESSKNPTKLDDESSGRESTAEKQKNVEIGCNSSKSPLHDSVSPTSMGSLPSANVSPFSDISYASSKTSYLESISPSSMSLIRSPYDERKCDEIDEKEISEDRNDGSSGSCGSWEDDSQERSHHSFQFSRFSRSPSGYFSPARSSRQERCYSPVRIFSLDRSDSRKRKDSLSKDHSSSRSRSPARYRKGNRYFSPEINYLEKDEFSPRRSPSWARYHTPNRNYSMDREDTYNSSRSRSPVRHSSEEKRYIGERGYRNHSPRSYTPVGSDRSRELYDSRKSEWQYGSDRHFSSTRGQYSSHTHGASHWENDFGQQDNRFSHNGQHSPSRRDESSHGSRSRSRCQSRKKKRRSSKSKESITMRALESLREVHVRECDMYRQNPAAHPDYNKEYWAFTEKKAQNILSLGGDPYTYDMSKDWEMYWPNRLQEIFNESWASKRDQCISMVIANRGRSHSPSSFSSDSSVSSSQSSDTRNYSRNYRKKRAKYSKSPSEDRESRVKERCRTKEKIRKSDRNRDSGSRYKDKGELKQQQRGNMHKVKNREKDGGDRSDDHYKEAKPSVSESAQEHDFQVGGIGTTKDPKKTEGTFDVNPGEVGIQEVNVAPMAGAGAPLTLKEAAVTGQSSSKPISGENLMQSEVLTDLSKAESNDSPKGMTSSSSGKENPNDLKDFKNQHSCLTAPPVSLECSAYESVENAQKLDNLTLYKIQQSSEEEVSSTTPLEENVKDDVIDVLEILSRLGERLGALSVPVQLLHEKALELKSGGLDTMKIFDEIDNKILLHMTGDKLRTALKGDSIPIIQKVIIQEGEQRLSLLLEKEKERSLLFDLNVDNIASACLGKSSADTTTFIENALLYHGYTEVSKDQLKRIHMAVKKEQVRILALGKNSSKSGNGVVNQSPEQPGNHIHQGSLSPSRDSNIAPCSSEHSQHLGSAPYSPSQISVSSEGSIPSLPPSPSLESVPHAPQILLQPVPPPFLNTSGCSRSPVDVGSDAARGEIEMSDCHSLLSDTTSMGNVAHTTHDDLHLQSDFGAFESKMDSNADASSSVSDMYDCYSGVSCTSDGKAATTSSNSRSAAHSVISNKSRQSASKVSSKKPIKITLPKPPAPRVFVRAFNPLGEDESESEDS